MLNLRWVHPTEVCDSRPSEKLRGRAKIFVPAPVDEPAFQQDRGVSLSYRFS
jgi:hypothetical protein